MNDFIKSLSTYIREAQINSILFWAIPFGTLLLTWLLTTIGLKLFTKRKILKTIFLVSRAWIISSLIVAGILVGLICFLWAKNYFAHNSLQLTLLLSLIIVMMIPVIRLIIIRNHYTQEGVKEIIDQPKTINQLDATITYLKKAFRRNKIYFLIPSIGFLFLLFYLNKGTNLISLVYDNSGSMIQSNAIDALSETFDNLEVNNEITLTTLEGFTTPEDPAGKVSMKDLMLVNKSSALKGGNIVSFNNPVEAKQGLSQASNPCFGSPICESIWKTYLFIKETKTNQLYKNKLLIIITDGKDNIDESLKSGKFFFDDSGFIDLFPPENVFVIDYSIDTSSTFILRCQNTGCDIYPASNNKQAYLDALDNALQSFKNNWYLIYWTILIYFMFTIVGLLIQPKKIV
jgi:hypothetical protein